MRQSADTPSCQLVLVNGEEKELFINSTKDTQKKTFNTLPDQKIDIGDVVVVRQTHWLVTKVDYDDSVTMFGEISQCNRQLTWQNQYTKKIISRWCTIDKPYYSNLEIERSMVVSNREFKIQLPYDEESCLLDLGKRFMLEVIGAEPKTYYVSSVDQNTERYVTTEGIRGFLVLNVTQDEWNPETDNIELGLCNYFTPDIPHSLGESFCEITITNRSDSIVQIGGLPTVFAAHFFDNEGNEVVSSVSWSLQTPTGFESKFHFDYDEHECTISADDHYKLAGHILILTASNSDQSIEKSIEVKVVSGL